MSEEDFGGLLNDAISGVQSAYKAAFVDLQKMVGKIRKPILEKYEERIRVALPRIEDETRGVVFALRLGNKTEEEDVVHFQLKPVGYPIDASALTICISAARRHFATPTPSPSIFAN